MAWKILFFSSFEIYRLKFWRQITSKKEACSPIKSKGKKTFKNKCIKSAPIRCEKDRNEQIFFIPLTKWGWMEILGDEKFSSSSSSSYHKISNDL